MATAAPSSLASSVEKTNGAKLSRLLIDGGTTVLRKVFDSHYPPASLAADLTAKFPTLHNLLKKKILRATQWEKLFPPGGATPDSNTFDITLLFLLLTNICGLTPPSSGWHTKPLPSDISLEANLARVKFFRNELYGHVSTTGVDTTNFSHLWKEISAVLVALGLGQVEINRLNAEHCGEEDYIDVLLEWAESEEDIKSQLKEIQQTVDLIRQSQSQDTKTLQQLHKDVLEVRKDFDDLSKKRLDDRAEELLNVLAMSEFKGDIEFYVTRFQEGTREWMFKKIANWLDDRDTPNRVMVISGNAGMGKSVISAVICKRMQEAGRLSGSHFCQHNNVRYRNPQLMLQSLASHLCRALPEYKKALVEQLSRNLGVEINSMGVEELFALLFKEPLNSIPDPGRNTLMVLDALDESEYKGRNELLDVIANHFNKLPQWIRFLVTTRPEVNISKSLSSLQPLHLESNGDDNKDDIRLFFRKELSRMVLAEDQEAIFNRLVEKSEGLILYAYFLADFIQKNVSCLTPNYLDSKLPLGICSVYQSYFNRLEKEFQQELKLDEDKFLSFLSIVMAAKEPLPLCFISKMFGISSNRKVMETISCISTLLPVRDGRLHIFHKSVNDWLTDTSVYGQHKFTVDKKEGSQILSKLCETELNVLKRNGTHDTQYSNTEKYVLQYGVQHILDFMDDQGQVIPCKLEKLVENYITDIELMYAKLCLGGTTGSDDLLNITKQGCFKLLPTSSQCAATTALSVIRKHKPVLRRHPQFFFQAMMNEGGQEFASKVSLILQNRYPEIPYVEILNKVDGTEEGRVEGRFECDSLVACFDVSPQMDYMVCECFNKSIQLWSLESGDRLWIRDALSVKSYGSPTTNTDCALRDVGVDLIDHEGHHVWNQSLSFYRSVVFHHDGKCVLPGCLTDVFAIEGDLKPLFPASSCSFTVCAFSGDKTKMLTDCPENPEHVALWDMTDGVEIGRCQRNNNLSSFAFSCDGTMVAISDCSEYTGLYKVNNFSFELLYEFCNPWICGLMHFSPDGQELVCGHVEFPDYSTSELYFRCLNYKMSTFEKSTGERWPYAADEPSWWPWEFNSVDEGRYLLTSESTEECLEDQDATKEHWARFPSGVVPNPFLMSGFFSMLSKESLLVGSPLAKELFMINVGKFEEYEPEQFRSNWESDGIEISIDGKYVFLIWIGGFDNEFDNFLEVDVYNEEGQKLNSDSVEFAPPFVLVPVEGGVLLQECDGELELRDSTLSKCVRKFPLTQVGSLKMIFPVTEHLVGCLGTLKNNLSKVDILNIKTSEIVSTTSVEGNITSVSCNNKFAFVACSKQSTPTEDKDEFGNSCRVVIATVAVWTERQHVWKRSVVVDDRDVQPSALITHNEDLVITWQSLDQGAGVHILNATTGITLHKLLTGQNDITECKFLSDGKHFVCCSGDKIARLFNVGTGELMTLIDIESYPYCVTACPNEPLFAVGLKERSYRIFRVHFPETKYSERKEKRIKLQ